MENITKVIPQVSLCHDIEGRRLRINVELPGVDEKKITMEMKKDSFCISAPRNGIEYSGYFLLDHEIEPDKTETRYENGVFKIITSFKGWEHWDRLREAFMGPPIVKG